MSATLSVGIDSLVLKIKSPVEADGVTPRDDLIEVKVWYSTISDFVPPAQGTLAYEGTGLDISITGLTSGTTYYVRYALVSEIQPEYFVLSSPLVGTPVYETQTVDTTPPPTPTGGEVSAGITTVFIKHDVPVYTQGRGHNKTHIFGLKESPEQDLLGYTFANAAAQGEIGQFTGNVWSFSSDPATTWHIWLKWESKNGILSTVAAGGTTGFETTTGQDVALLLEVLTDQITENQLFTDLGTRIDLIDGDGVGSVNERIEQEAVARSIAIAGEADARNVAIADSTRPLLQNADALAEAMLANTLATHEETLARQREVAYARTELTENFEAGIAAEAAERTQLIAKLDTDIATTTALINAESVARTDAVSAEAAERNLLAAQFRGSYEGSDLAQVTEGLLYQEKIARANATGSLAEQLTLLSAGAVEQFDWKSIWYFDEDVEGWSGNGTPTVARGYLRAANQASDAYVVSPVGVGAEGVKYAQVRLRIRKVGTPVFAGFLWWKSAEDTTWDAARRVSIDEPTYDSNNIGLITLNPQWAVTVDALRVDLSSAQTETDYFEIDWVAIGRPSPGASSAQVFDLSTATVDATNSTSLASKLTVLTATVNDPVTGLTATNATLTNDYYTSADADTAVASAQQSLLAEFGNRSSKVFRQASEPLQGTDNVTLADNTVATVAKIKTGDVWYDTDDGNKPHVFDGTAWIYAPDTSTASATAYTNNLETALATSTGAEVTAIRDTVAEFSDPETGYATTRAQVTEVTNTVASEGEARATTDRAIFAAANADAETTLLGILTANQQKEKINQTLAYFSEEIRADIKEGLSAEASAREVLAATVDTNAAAATAAIEQESLVRVAAESVLAQDISKVSARFVNLAEDQTVESYVTNYTYSKSGADGAIASAESYLIARTAQSTSKAFWQNDAPTKRGTDPVTAADIPLEANDAWYDTNDGNKLYRWTGTAWAASSDSSALGSWITDTYTPELTALEQQVGAKIETWFQTADPSTAWTTDALKLEHNGDLWYNSTTKLFKRYARTGTNTGSWTTVEDAAAIAAAQAASDAQDTADGKVVSFAQASQPEAEGIGDLWIDTDDKNKLYRWSGTAWLSLRDGTIADVDARVTNVETAKIGYATKNGLVFDNNGAIKDKAGVDAWNLANPADLAVWNVGLPFATAVKQVSISDGDDALTLEQRFVAQKDTNGGILGKYSVKIDSNGYVSGFGLVSTANNATPYSDFIISADKFSIASPAGPTITPIIPFVVNTTPQTINGVEVPVGIYMDAAYIKNGTITDVKIGTAAITNAKIASLDATKITTGQLVADRINSNGLSIRDTAGNLLLDATNNQLGVSLFVGSGSNQRLLSTIGAYASVPNTAYIGEFASAPVFSAVRTIIAWTRTAGITTVTTSTTHGFVVGSKVTITLSSTTLNGTYEIAEVVSNTAFKVVNAGTNATGTTGTATGYLYAENSVYKNTVDKNSYILTGAPLAWSLFLEKGTSGTPGTPGANGARGSAWAYLSGYTVWNSTTEAAVNTYFTNTYGTKVLNDVVTVYGTNFSQTRSWNGSSWIQVTVAIDGNLLVTGTVSGQSIVGNSVTADKIDSRGLTIKDSTDTVIFGSGTNLDWSRIADADRGLSNLINVDWWKRVAAIPWSQNSGQNTILSLPGDVGVLGVKGGSDTVWYAYETTYNVQGGGGWNAGISGLNPNKTYRFVVPVMVLNAANGGSVYWGTEGVCSLNTTSPIGNPYFSVWGRPNMVNNRWYLMVGYVFPYGSVNHDHSGAGIIDCTTGKFISGGTNYNHTATGANVHRAYQYYANYGAATLFGRPSINVVDGNEPSLQEYYARGNFAALDLLTSSNVSTYIASAAIGEAYIGTISASKINTNGLVIRDVNGGIILGSGTALNASYAAPGTVNSDLVPSINSAASTAVWGNVSGGGKPQDYATYGATFGTNISGQITPDNASTFIANASINTLRIAGNSVTVAASAAGTGTQTVYLNSLAGGILNIIAQVDQAGNANPNNRLNIYINGGLAEIVQGSQVVIGNVVTNYDSGENYDVYAWTQAIRVRAWGVGAGSISVTFESTEGRYYTGIVLLTQR